MRTGGMVCPQLVSSPVQFRRNSCAYDGSLIFYGRDPQEQLSTASDVVRGSRVASGWEGCAPIASPGSARSAASQAEEDGGWASASLSASSSAPPRCWHS